MSDSKNDVMRLFVAIPVPEQAANKLKSWVNERREELPFRKWTHPLDYHITLQFLGDVSMKKVDEIRTVLSATSACSLQLSLNGIGTFGLPKAPRVLWAAVTGELEYLSVLQRAVTGAMSSLGFEAELRPYSPHITLARGFAGGKDTTVSNGTDSTEAADWIGSGEVSEALIGSDWVVDSFVLMRTHMHASPMYEVIGRFPLSSK